MHESNHSEASLPPISLSLHDSEGTAVEGSVVIDGFRIMSGDLNFRFSTSGIVSQSSTFSGAISAASRRAGQVLGQTPATPAPSGPPPSNSFTPLVSGAAAAASGQWVSVHVSRPWILHQLLEAQHIIREASADLRSALECGQKSDLSATPPLTRLLFLLEQAAEKLTKASDRLVLPSQKLFPKTDSRETLCYEPRLPRDIIADWQLRDGYLVLLIYRLLISTHGAVSAPIPHGPDGSVTHSPPSTTPSPPVLQSTGSGSGMPQFQLQTGSSSQPSTSTPSSTSSSSSSSSTATTATSAVLVDAVDGSMHPAEPPRYGARSVPPDATPSPAGFSSAYHHHHFAYSGDQSRKDREIINSEDQFVGHAFPLPSGVVVEVAEMIEHRIHMPSLLSLLELLHEAQQETLNLRHKFEAMSFCLQSHSRVEMEKALNNSPIAVGVPARSR